MPDLSIESNLDKIVVYLPFDDPNDPFFDACGNKWNVLYYDDSPAEEDEYFDASDGITTGKFGNGYEFFNSIHLIIDKPIKLGGKSFTVDFWYEYEYYDETGIGLFEIVSTETNTPLVSLYDSGYQWSENYEDYEPTLTLKVRNSSGEISEHMIFIPYDDTNFYGGYHHYAFVYDDIRKEAYFYVDGDKVSSFVLINIAEQDCTITIGKVAEGYYQLCGKLDEFRITELALWTSDFTPPEQQQIMFYKVNSDFDINRNIIKSISVDFDIARKILKSGGWYYENFGNALLLKIDGGTTYADLPPEKSKTGSAFSINIADNIFGLQPTNEIWAKFDVYLSGDDGFFACSYDNGLYNGVRINSYTHNYTYVLAANIRSGVWGNSYTQYKSDTISGFHTVLLHMLSHSSNGVVQLWIDDENNPIFDYSDNVNNGDNFSNFFISRTQGIPLISNLILSNHQLYLTDNVEFVGYSYVKDIDVERAIKNDTFFEKLLDATKVLLTFDDDNAPFKDLGGNHWTAHGNPTISAENAKFGKALQLDGSNYLQMDNQIELGGQDFTIDGYFCIPSNGEQGNYAYICYLLGDEVANYGYNYEITFYCSYADQAHFSVTLPNGNGRSNASETVYNITRNEIHHFAICLNHQSQKMVFAIDGKVYVKDIHSVRATMEYSVLVGGLTNIHNAEYSFRGAIDEFRIINGIALYSHDFTPPTESAWAKKINLDFDMIRQISQKLVVTPTEDFIAVVKDETDGIQSIEINIATQQLTDQLTYATVNNVDIMQQVQGQYLDYKFDMRIEETNQWGILTTCKCCSDIDEILYTPINYVVNADFVTYEVDIKSKTINTVLLTEETQTSENLIQKATATNHLQHIAQALGKNLVTSFDDFISDLDLEQKSVTYSDLLSNLFGWTSRLPHILINCYIRNDTIYVIQRGKESNIVDLTVAKCTVPTITKKIIRTTWGGEPDSSYTLNKFYPGYRISIPPPTISDDGKTTYTYKQITHGGYLLTGSTTKNDDGSIVYVRYEYSTLYPIELLEEVTERVDQDGHIIETSVVKHQSLNPSQRQTRIFDEDGNESGSVVGSHVAGFYENYETISVSHTESEEATINGNPLLDTNFPIYGNDKLIELSNEIRWLNRKTQEVITFDVYDYPHVIDFNDKIIFKGNEYYLESNTVTKTPNIVNKQSLILVRWY